jgi:SAM-dependent methyltransferase
MNVDFGRTAGDYGRHRAGFPDSKFERLTRYGVGLRGQRVVDVGTGTGTVARGFALRGCAVIGIDPSEELIGEARRLDAEAGVSVDYGIAKAEATHLGDGSVDVYAAGQCWHWPDPGQRWGGGVTGRRCCAAFRRGARSHARRALSGRPAGRAPSRLGARRAPSLSEPAGFSSGWWW